MTAGKNLKRRLAAVMAVDAVGYSRLMGVDEEGTHRRLKSILRDILLPFVAQHGGRVFKSTGDGALAEFTSAVDATECAIQIQRTVQTHEKARSAKERVQFRIGINVGDVIVEPDELYGDDVNIAVRLEGLADPGAIFVSQVVADQVGDRRGAKFTEIGVRKLKNIKRPIRVYRLEIPEGPAAVEPLIRMPTSSIVVQRTVDRPAIAVLPFANMSGDPAEDYFADGLSEDIITKLARWRTLPVIARNSTFTYKGKHVDVRAVGQELRARYVLEGSVRRSGSRVRIAAQLIEADSNAHLFAEHYDRELTDLFAVQDEITTSIVGEVEPELLRSERDRIASSPQEKLDAYDCYQRGLWHHYRYTNEDGSHAQRFFLKALELDPDYAQAAAALGITLVHSTLSGWTDATRATLVEASRFAERAMRLDPRDPQSHFAFGLVNYHLGQVKPALVAMREAIRLNPSYAAAYANQAFLLNYLNRPQESLQSTATAFRLSPHDVRRFIWHTALAGAHYLSGEFEEAVEVGLGGLRLKADFLPPLTYVVAALGQMGRRAEAEIYLPRLRQLHGAGSEAYLRRWFVDETAMNFVLDGLRKAGLS
ncbi:MAG TPA: adenylate/guanylate cyclase domain-containing protein [Alphaproteobacteria bacterium]